MTDKKEILTEDDAARRRAALRSGSGSSGSAEEEKPVTRRSSSTGQTLAPMQRTKKKTPKRRRSSTPNPKVKKITKTGKEVNKDTDAPLGEPLQVPDSDRPETQLPSEIIQLANTGKGDTEVLQTATGGDPGTGGTNKGGGKSGSKGGTYTDLELIDKRTFVEIFGVEFSTCWDSLTWTNLGLLAAYGALGAVVTPIVAKIVYGDVKNVSIWLAQKTPVVGDALIKVDKVLQPSERAAVQSFKTELAQLKATAENMKKSGTKVSQVADELGNLTKTGARKALLISRSAAWIIALAVGAAAGFSALSNDKDIRGESAWQSEGFWTTIIHMLAIIRLIDTLIIKKIFDVSLEQTDLSDDCNMANLLVSIAIFSTLIGLAKSRGGWKSARRVSQLFVQNAKSLRGDLATQCSSLFRSACDNIIIELKKPVRGRKVMSAELEEALENISKSIASGQAAQAKQIVAQTSGKIRDAEKGFNADDYYYLQEFLIRVERDLSLIYKQLLKDYISLAKTSATSAQNSLNSTKSQITNSVNRLSASAQAQFKSVRNLGKKSPAPRGPQTALPTIDITNVRGAIASIDKFALHGDPLQAINLARSLSGELAKVEVVAGTTLGSQGAKSLTDVLTKLNVARTRANFNRRTLDNLIDLSSRGRLHFRIEPGLKGPAASSAASAEKIIERYTGDLLYYLNHPLARTGKEGLEAARKVLSSKAKELENAIFLEASKRPKFSKVLTGSNNVKELALNHPLFTITSLAALGLIADFVINTTNVEPKIDDSPMEYSGVLPDSVAAVLNSYTGAKKYKDISEIVLNDSGFVRRSLGTILNPNNANVKKIINQVATSTPALEDFDRDTIPEKVNAALKNLGEAQKEVLLSRALADNRTRSKVLNVSSNEQKMAAQEIIVDLLVYKSNLKQRLQNYYNTNHANQTIENRKIMLQRVFKFTSADLDSIRLEARKTNNYARKKLRILGPPAKRDDKNKQEERNKNVVADRSSIVSQKDRLSKVIMVGDSNAAGMTFAVHKRVIKNHRKNYKKIRGYAGVPYRLPGEKVPYAGPALGAARTDQILRDTKKYFQDPNVPQDRINNLEIAIVHMGYNDFDRPNSAQFSLNNIQKTVDFLISKGIEVRVLDVKVSDRAEKKRKSHVDQLSKLLRGRSRGGEGPGIQKASLIQNNGIQTSDGVHFKNAGTMFLDALMGTKVMGPVEVKGEKDLRLAFALASMIMIETSGRPHLGGEVAAAVAFNREDDPNYKHKDLYGVVQGNSSSRGAGDAWNSSKDYTTAFRKLYTKYKEGETPTSAEVKSLDLAISYISDRAAVQSKYRGAIGFIHPQSMVRQKNFIPLNLKTARIPGNMGLYGTIYVPRWIMNAYKSGNLFFFGGRILVQFKSGGGRNLKSGRKSRTPQYNFPIRRKAGGTIQEEVIQMNKLDLKDLVKEMLSENSGQGYAKYPYHSDHYSEEEPADDYIEEWKSFCLDVVRDESNSLAIEVAKILVKDLELFEDVLDLAGQNQSVGVEILSKLKEARESNKV